ncbi:hypothetical protein BJS_08988 [Bradyrhizobium japonicum SEMIA 5079]|nr:hypothetical protein BJS_08988 [Bradyrhizobium japonicum SEMIA 5079]
MVTWLLRLDQFQHELRLPGPVASNQDRDAVSVQFVGLKVEINLIRIVCRGKSCRDVKAAGRIKRLIQRLGSQITAAVPKGDIS